MKKLVPLVAITVLVALGCQKNTKQKTTETPLLTTLNGIDEATFTKMQHHFMEYRDIDPTPMNTNVWFDSTTVHRIVNLLEHEGADGIRIYFISDLSKTSPHLKNSVALISTHANGSDNSAPSGNIHKDYYEHNASDALFTNINIIRGLSSNNIQSQEAMLYTSSIKRESDAVDYSANPHHISRQLAVHMVQGFGTHAINTVSEWFDLKLFQSFTKDPVADGMRIYFSTKPQDGTETAGTDAFVLTKTIPGLIKGTHVDILNPIVRHSGFGQLTDGGNDNGEQCPTNCSGTSKP